MKTKTLFRGITAGVITLLLVAGVSLKVYSTANGQAGRTLKGSTPGCTCHSSGQSTAVLPVITGPTTLAPGATGTYTFNITRSSGTFNTGGIDIAVSSGTLGIGTSTGIKILSSEVI